MARVFKRFQVFVFIGIIAAVTIQLGIIGGGEVTEAILSRLLNQQIYPPDKVLTSTPQSTRQDFWHCQIQR